MVLPIVSKKDKRKRGKPSNTVIDKIRTQVWYNALLINSGKHNPNQLEKIFFPENFDIGENGEDRRSKIFYKYRDGNAVPSEELVQRAESQYPGTRFWLHLPLWKVIDGRPLTNSDLYDIVVQIKPSIACYFDKSKCSASKSKPHDYTSTHSLDSLFRQGDIEAFTILLGLIRGAVNRYDHFLLADAIVLSTYLSLLILSNEPLNSVRNQLFDYLNTKFFTYKFTEGLEFNADYISIDRAVFLVQNAILVAKSIGLKCDTPKEQGRFVYWMWREGYFEIGNCVLGYWTRPAMDDEYFQNYIKPLHERLNTNELSNPRRELNILQTIIFNRKLICMDHAAEYLEELHEKKKNFLRNYKHGD